MSSKSMNARARWGNTVIHAQTLSRLGRPSPMSGDALPMRYWARASRTPLWQSPSVSAPATVESLDRPQIVNAGEANAPIPGRSER